MRTLVVGVSLTAGLVASTPVFGQTLKIQPSTVIGTAGSNINVTVRASVNQPTALLQFTLDYRSSVATFVSATIGADLQAQGFYISNVTINPVVPPSTPTTDKNLVVQIFGGAAGSFTGSNLSAAVLVFRLNSGICDASPAAFESICTPNTHMVTSALQTICPPTLQLYSGVIATSCATEASNSQPTTSPYLYANFPNPFNPSTSIRYSMPATDRVRLEVLDVTGRLVRVLVDKAEQSGPHEVVWNGTDTAGNRVPSGVYHSRLTSGNRSMTRRMLLVK